MVGLVPARMDLAWIVVAVAVAASGCGGGRPRTVAPAPPRPPAARPQAAVPHRTELRAATRRVGVAAEQGGPAAVRQAYVSLVSLFRASRREIAAQSPAAARGIRGAVTALGIAVRIGVPRQIKLASDVLQDAIDSQPAG